MIDVDSETALLAAQCPYGRRLRDGNDLFFGGSCIDPCCCSEEVNAPRYYSWLVRRRRNHDGGCGPILWHLRTQDIRQSLLFQLYFTSNMGGKDAAGALEKLHQVFPIARQECPTRSDSPRTEFQPPIVTQSCVTVSTSTIQQEDTVLYWRDTRFLGGSISGPEKPVLLDKFARRTLFLSSS